MDLSALRQEYTHTGIDIHDLNPNPFLQFIDWFQLALRSSIREPNAMVLSTIGPDHYPQSRTVLLKEQDATGFIFFTNYNSDKAKQIEYNPKASLLFVWLELERQIKIIGTLEKVSQEKSLHYFQTRPRLSQLGAWTSVYQSSPILSREYLEQEYAKVEERFKGVDPLPLPPFWGGFKLVPNKFEFWQGRTNRLHDRFLYQQDSTSASTWSITRLSP